MRPRTSSISIDQIPTAFETRTWASPGTAEPPSVTSPGNVRVCVSFTSVLVTIGAGRVDWIVGTEVVDGSTVEDVGTATAGSRNPCLLYTSDAADEEDSVDLGG